MRLLSNALVARVLSIVLLLTGALLVSVAHLGLLGFGLIVLGLLVLVYAVTRAKKIQS